MKKFLIFILIAAAGYFAYEYLIKEKQVLEIKADKLVTTSFSMDIEAPRSSPLTYGSVQGTAKNISDKLITDIVLKYKLDGKPLEVLIYSLEPGEMKSFSTENIVIRGASSPFYLDSLSYK